MTARPGNDWSALRNWQLGLRIGAATSVAGSATVIAQIVARHAPTLGAIQAVVVLLSVAGLSVWVIGELTLAVVVPLGISLHSSATSLRGLEAASHELPGPVVEAMELGFRLSRERDATRPNPEDL